MSSEYVTIVEAQDYGDPEKAIHPVNRILSKSKAKNKTVLEILVNDAGCKFIPKHNFILDAAGRLILPGQLMECYAILPGTVRCPVCALSSDWNTILAHLQGDFQKGHKLNTDKTIKLFKDEFWNWSYRNGSWIKDEAI